MISKLVQYWLAWPVSFITANLTFLGSVRMYYVKYLSTCIQSRKSWESKHPLKVGTLSLMFLRYFSSWLCALRWVFHSAFGCNRVFSVLGGSCAVFKWLVFLQFGLRFEQWVKLSWCVDEYSDKLLGIYMGSGVWFISLSSKHGLPPRVGLHNEILTKD